MPTATPTFRLFVSSTFEDLAEERDALQRMVFPNLRALCEEHGARFQAIDLRWGVRTEAALDQRTMDICLTEIDRCQRTGITPNFIVLLGDRYGWRPLPLRVAAAEFERVRAHVSDAAKQSLLDTWYRRDDNAVPPEYLLQPRAGEFESDARWARLEQELRGLLWNGALAAGLPAEFLAKYGASATHQEVLKGLGRAGENRGHVFAFLREPVAGSVEDADVAALKEDLEATLPPDHVHRFARGDASGLCACAERLLADAIRREVGRFGSVEPLDSEIHAHADAAHSLARHFTGRVGPLDAIGRYLSGDDRRPLVLTGAPGSGKSAVIAEAYRRHTVAFPESVVVCRFVGLSPPSSNGATLLRSVCDEVGRSYDRPMSPAVEDAALTAALFKLLACATRERPLVLFVDAIDQLGDHDPYRRAAWLPAELPAHCRVVLSAAEVAPGSNSVNRVELERLSTVEADQALSLWLHDAGRTLSPHQRTYVLEQFDRCGLPLYLRLAFEEARRWKHSDPPERCRLGEGVPGIIDAVLDSIAEEVNHGPVLARRSLECLAAARFGLTEDEMLSVLSADDDVWNDLCARAHHRPPQRVLPVVVWSRLQFDLDRYLSERAVPGGVVVAFRQRQFRERVAARYFSGDRRTSCHSALATCFAQSFSMASDRVVDDVVPAAVSAARPGSVRCLSELPYQLRNARQWEALRDRLTHAGFLQAKIEAGLAADLLDDFAHFDRDGRRIPEASQAAESCSLLARALADAREAICDEPASLAGQLLIGVQDSQAPDTQQLQRRITQTASGRPTMARVARHGVPTRRYVAQMATTRAYQHYLRFSQDGERLLSCDVTGCVARWDWRSYRVTRSPRPDEGTYRNGALLSDRSFAATNGQDAWLFDTVDIWADDLAMGSWRRLRHADPGGELGAVSDAPSGYALLAQTGREVNRLLRISGGTVDAEWRLPGTSLQPLVNHVAVSRDGATRAICFGDGMLALSTGWVGRAHAGATYHGEFVESDSAFLTCGGDGTAALWTLQHGLRSRLELPDPEPADCLAWSGARALAAVGQRSGFVALCELGQHPSVVRRFRPGVGGWILSLCFSPCGGWLAVGGRHGTVRIFDVGELLEGHTLDGGILLRRSPGPAFCSVIVPGGRGCYFQAQSGRLHSTLETARSEWLPLSCGPFTIDRSRGEVVVALPGAIQRLELATGAPLQASPLPGAAFTSINVSHDGRILAGVGGGEIAAYEIGADGLVGRRLASARLQAPLRESVPLTFLDAHRIVFPLEELTQVRDAALGPGTSHRRHRLCVFDCRTGGADATEPLYSGWCHAIQLRDEGSVLILAIADPWHITEGAAGGMATGYVQAPDSGLVLYSIGDRKVIARLPSPPADGGAVALATHPGTGMVVAGFRRGRVRIASTEPLRWMQSVLLPGGACAVSIDTGGSILWAGDDGSSTDSWPLVHGFVLDDPFRKG